MATKLRHDCCFQIDDSTHWVPEVQPDPQGRYVTYWIARQGSQIKIRKVEDLTVPRATGFWHVGVQLPAWSPLRT